MKTRVNDIVWRINLWIASGPAWRIALVGVAALLAPEPAAAFSLFGTGSGTTLPWMQPLTEIAQALGGPVARVGVLIAIAFFGILLMFGELKGIFSTAARLLLGAAVALGAAQWAGILTPAGGGGSGISTYIGS